MHGTTGLSLVVDTLGLLRSLQVSLTWTKALGLRHFFETFQKCTTHNSGWTSLFFGWFVFWNFWILFGNFWEKFGNFWEKFKFKNGRSWAVTSLLFLGSRHPHKNMKKHRSKNWRERYIGLFYAAYAGHGILCTSIGFNFAIIDNGSWIPLSLHISQFVLCCIRGCHQRKPAASGHKVRLSIRGFVCNSRILSIRGFVC